MVLRMPVKIFLKMILFASLGLIPACGAISTTYKVGKGTVSATYDAAKGTAKLALGTGKLVYKIGGFTFKVVQAPLTWPLTRDEIETIDGLPPKDAIRQGRVKNAPYTVRGRRYKPLSLEEARHFKETGTASWYGNETRYRQGGHMTANGEAFDPEGFTAAHKYLPLPYHVRVTNLENRRSMIVRVNDRGPFYGDRVIDLSAGAAKKLGFYRRGTARVRVEAIDPGAE
jgi:rare lipoprotein A